MAAEYQSMVSPMPGFAMSVTEPAPQRAAPVPDGVLTILLITAFTAVRVAETQPEVVFLDSAK